MDAALTVTGHLLLGSLFVIGGIRHFFIFPVLVPMVAARGVPFARAALLGATLLEIAAGAALMMGLYVPWAAAGLAAFTLAATVLMLNFWSLEGPARDAAINGWLSNLAILGGLLLTVAKAP